VSRKTGNRRDPYGHISGLPGGRRQAGQAGGGSGRAGSGTARAVRVPDVALPGECRGPACVT